MSASGNVLLRSYVLIFNSVFVPRQTMLDFLNTRREVLNWYAFLDGTIFIISRQNATQLGEMIHTQFPTVFFLVTTVPNYDNNGWLPKAAWDFINIPRSSGRWE